MESLKKIFATLFLTYLLSMTAIAAPVTMTETECDQLLTDLEKNLAGLKTLNAAFEQQKHISLFDETLIAQGRLLFESPGKIRFEIALPFRSVLVVSGKEVGKYEHNDNAWKKLNLQNTDGIALVMKQIADWMNGKFRQQSRLFGLSAENRDGKTILILTSKPKQFAELIKQIEIQVAPDRSRFESITILENGGDYTVLAFTSDDRTQTFPAGTFDTTRETPVELPVPAVP